MSIYKPLPQPITNTQRVRLHNWIHALQSGAYQQTRSHLRDPLGFCCLGVMCDLAIKDNPKLGSWEDQDGELVFTHGQMRELTDENENVIGEELKYYTDLPSEEVYQLYGINDAIANQLASLNDKGASFKAIADVMMYIVAETPMKEEN